MFGSAVLNRRLRSRVLLVLKSGDAFEGILWEADREAFVLRNVTATAESTNPDPIVSPFDGELVVLTADVAHVQIL